MKIVHVIESAGGSMDFVLYLVKYLPQHDHVVVHGKRALGSRYESAKGKYQHVEFVLWEYAQREIRVREDIMATLFLYKLLKNAKADVVHLHSSKAGFLGRIGCFVAGARKAIYTPNGLAFLRTDVSPFKRKMYIMLEQVANKLSGKVVACSKSEADALIEVGIPSAYVNNGTEVKSCSAKVQESRLIIATSGRVTAQKNPVMFNSIAKSFEGDRNITFLWIGGGELENELTAKNIVITGWLDLETVLNKVQESDIYISTALWEGLPFAVLEAMSLSKPLILNKCVGNVDLVTDNGFLIDSVEAAVDKISFFNRNRDQILACGTNSFELVNKNFTVEEMAHKYDQVYKFY
jgi:glycosyltransferase involved in cell wall biosynthesis